MNCLFVPNYFTLLEGGSDDVEICEDPDKNLSGESMHRFLFHCTDKVSKQYDKEFLLQLSIDIKDSQIAIRGVDGGIQVVTSFRILNGKLGEMTAYKQSPGSIYFLFLLKSTLYMINYYYYILDEKDIRIQKDAFQTLYINNRNVAENYNKFKTIFLSLETTLKNIGFFGFLFIHHEDTDQYVLKESAFLSLCSNQSIDQNYEELKVFIIYI